MPAVKNGSKSPTSATANGNGGGNPLPTFVSCELNDDERQHVKTRLIGSVDMVDQIEGLVQEGYKFSFSFDERSQAIMVVGTGQNTSANKGLALSARAPSVVGAWTVWCYKHYEKLKEHWGDAPQNSQRQSWG